MKIDAEVFDEVLRTLSTPDLLARIGELQEIQKTHSPKTPAWQTASELLAPCFAEMAKREPSQK